MVSILVLLLYY